MALGLIHSACTCASKARMTRLGDALLRTRICTASPPPRWSQSQPTSFACRVMAFKGTAHLDRLPAPPLLPSVWSTSALFWLFSTAVYIHRHVYMHMYTCTPTRTRCSKARLTLDALRVVLVEVFHVGRVHHLALQHTQQSHQMLEVHASRVVPRLCTARWGAGEGQRR